MPRIRTLKPEHRQHRKVGPLDHLTYRLWVGLILEADDEGRLAYDPAQLHAVIFPYHARVSLAQIRQAVDRLTTLGLARVYQVDGQNYLDLPSWGDHQVVDRKRPSKLPEYKDSPNDRRMIVEPSTMSRGGSEGKGTEGNGSTTSSSSSEDAAAVTVTGRWGTPEALAELYNQATPDNVSAVETLSAKRRDKARRALRLQPDRAWWEDTFREYHRSGFLSGRHPPSNGQYANFKPDFDWILSNGRDGTENAVKVHDGKYRDGGR